LTVIFVSRLFAANWRAFLACRMPQRQMCAFS
jgi:hypothetical protein